MLKRVLAALSFSVVVSAPALAAGRDYYAVNLQHPNFGQKFADLVNDGHVIKKVALFGEEGTVILFDHNGWWAEGIPEELTAKLDEISKTDDEIKSLAFTKEGGFVLLYGVRSTFTKGVDASRLELLEQEAQYEFKDLIFPDDGGIVLLEADGTYAWNGLQVEGALNKTLHELADQQKHFDTMFMTPSGGFMLLNQGEVIHSENVPECLVERISGLHASGEMARSLSFINEDRWILVW